MNGEFSDIASGKKDRTDHERIGAERDAFAVQRKNCAIVHWLEQFVAKLRQHHLFDQLVTQFSPAAVSEDNLLVIGDRQRTGSAEKGDVFHYLDDIFGSERDVDQIPKHMHQRGVHFLYPVNAIGRDDETVIGDLGETSPILSAPRDRKHLFFARFFERINEVWRLATGAYRQRHVARLA